MSRLSHSQVNKFMDCPKSYEYHYINKYRTSTQHAALLFGTAIDKASEQLFNPKGSITAEEVFEKTWRFQEVNKVNTYLPNCIEIVYAESDFDKDLLTLDARKKIREEFDLSEEALDKQITEVYKEKEYLGFNNLPDNRKQFLNTINWWCLHYKGLLMLATLRKEVLPKMGKVYDTQVFTKLENGEGDSIIGYADLVCDFEGFDKPVIFDVKTSTKEYDSTAVLTSTQLSLYVHSLSDQYSHTRNAGYIVLSKIIRKNKEKTCKKCGYENQGTNHKTCNASVGDERCGGEWDVVMKPEAKVTILVNEIPERTEDIVLENYEHVNTAIKRKEFHRNFNSCKKGYGLCSFYNLCYKNSEEGLVVRQKDE